MQPSWSAETEGEYQNCSIRDPIALVGMLASDGDLASITRYIIDELERTLRS